MFQYLRNNFEVLNNLKGAKFVARNSHLMHRMLCSIVVFLCAYWRVINTGQLPLGTGWQSWADIAHLHLSTLEYAGSSWHPGFTVCITILLTLSFAG